MGEIQKLFADILSVKGLVNIAFIIFFLMGALLINTMVHEFGHFIVGRIVGCQTAYAWIRMFTGATYFECPEGAYAQVRIIALAGPLISFIWGLYLWYAFGENSYARVMALFAFLYSTLPNLSFIPGSDLMVAIENGLSYPAGFGLFVAIFGITGLLIFREVLDREWAIE